MKSGLPFFVGGKVVKGFGRGSKSLGTPTANFEQSVVDLLPSELSKGIYFGWAQVNESPVYPMVACIGWNPFFRNQVKSMETHIMHNFDEDFYGSHLNVCLVGYIRDELNFTNLDSWVFIIEYAGEGRIPTLERISQGVYCRESRFRKILAQIVINNFLDMYIKDDLKEKIREDIDIAKRELLMPDFFQHSKSDFFNGCRS